MNTVKETTLHPDGNDGVDLYPKTNINQVEGLKEKIEIYDNYQERIINLENYDIILNNTKLTKPATPAADSFVTMLADGTVGTKPLSEISGGKLYQHKIKFVYNYPDGDGLMCTVYLIDNYSNSYTYFNLKNKYPVLQANMEFGSMTLAENGYCVGIIRLDSTSYEVIGNFIMEQSVTNAIKVENITLMSAAISDTVTEL